MSLSVDYSGKECLLASAWVMFPLPVCGENSLHKTEMSIYHSQYPEVAMGLPLWHPLREKIAFPSLPFVHTLHFPITHLANRKESQTGLAA